MTPALSPEGLLLLALLTPFVGAAILPLFHDRPNLRETVTLATSAVLALVVLQLLGPVLQSARPELDVIHVLPGLSVAFKVEPLGMLFALVASSLWFVNSIYSIGYMRANQEPRQTTFYVCFAIALGSTIGIAAIAAAAATIRKPRSHRANHPRRSRMPLRASRIEPPLTPSTRRPARPPAGVIHGSLPRRNEQCHRCS